MFKVELTPASDPPLKNLLRLTVEEGKTQLDKSELGFILAFEKNLAN